MNRRAGVTLIEVLVSIFIMAVGLLALLTLFPIGALTMRQAIIDDRTAHAVSAADAVVDALGIRHDVAFQAPFLNPDPNTFVDAPPNGPSHPLFVDPTGFISYIGLNSSRVGGQVNGIPRTTTSLVGVDANLIRQWFTSLDDVIFARNAKPDFVNPQVFDRNSVYSWAYMIQRPKQGVPSIVDLTVVVFNSRPTSLTNALQTGESVYKASFSPVDNIVQIRWDPNGTPPDISLGSWILDCSPVLLQYDQNGPVAKFGPAHARFYRVVGLTELGTIADPTDPNKVVNAIDVETQSPLQGFPIPPPAPNLPPGYNANITPYEGLVVVMDGIAEVYQKSAGWRP